MEYQRFDAEQWRMLQDEYTQSWQPYLDEALERRSHGIQHPIADFLFDYYPARFSQLRRWHPGAGVLLDNSAELPRASWKWYRTCGKATRVDHAGFFTKYHDSIAYIEELLRNTLNRPGQFNCFGLHEWAMVYRLQPGQRRHEQLPLRLQQREVDTVVEQHNLCCTHVDAYRFFTEPASPRNANALSRQTQTDFEQPGCLHANMDLYKWALKLGPLVPGGLLFRCFALAYEIRQVDMQASAYDVQSFQLHPIKIETSEGKSAYVRRQRDFMKRANALRTEILQVISFVKSISALD